MLVLNTHNISGDIRTWYSDLRTLVAALEGAYYFPCWTPQSCFLQSLTAYHLPQISLSPEFGVQRFLVGLQIQNRATFQILAPPECDTPRHYLFRSEMQKNRRVQMETSNKPSFQCAVSWQVADPVPSCCSGSFLFDCDVEISKEIA